MPTFFSVRRLGAAYGDIQALWDVSLEVAEGEIVALIGPNGAGKTTLMRAIAGLHRPLAGEIMLNGAPLRCAGGADTGDSCLSDIQIETLKAMNAPVKFGFPLAPLSGKWSVTSSNFTRGRGKTAKVLRPATVRSSP